MRAAAVVAALGPIDWKSVRRDSLLRWMFAMPLLIAAMFRFGLPPFARWLDGRFGVALDPYVPLLGSMLVMVTPMMYGTVIGPSKRVKRRIFSPFSSVKARSMKSRAISALLLPVGLTVTPLKLFIGGRSISGPARRLVSEVPQATSARQARKVSAGLMRASRI